MFTLWAALAWTAAINGSSARTPPYGRLALPLLPLAISCGDHRRSLLLLSKLWDCCSMRCRRHGSSLFSFTASSAANGWLLAAAGCCPASGVAGRSRRCADGLFAVPAAIALATGAAEGRKAAILWNIFGLADFVVAITLGMIISPGRVPADRPIGPSIGLDGYPNVLTPAFVVPGSILLHALSLRQLRLRSSAEGSGA